MPWRVEKERSALLEKPAVREDDTWTQTVLTITPEDDAVLREIKKTAAVSARAIDLVDLYTDSFAYRRPLTPKYLVDPNELENEDTRHTQTQTYLQGIPVVDIPVRYKDEVSQTVYMSTPCPPLKHYKDIMTSMRDGPLPRMGNTRQTQTILTFFTNESHEVVTKRLNIDITNEEEIGNAGFVWEENDYVRAEVEGLAWDAAFYIQERAFWILDPSSFSHSSTIDNHAQTSIRYNQLTDSIVVDDETQTELSCEPKYSNTQLVANYQAKKDLFKDIIEECLNKATERMILAQTTMDEIVEKCVEKIRPPLKDQDIQTLATYNVHENKDDVLRKLQLPIVVDPLEASIVVVPLMDDLLELVCKTVSADAHRVTDKVLESALTRSISIISRIDEIRKQSNGKLDEQLLNRRRQKIAMSMAKKKTETVSTQTNISGIDEIKLDEPLTETLSCICLKQSKCNVCLSTKIDKKLETKMLRTKDILLAYKPCQVVSSHLEFDRMSSKSIKERLPKNQIPFSDDSSSDSTATLEVVLKPKERVKLNDSLDGWTSAIDAALTIPWSPKSSLSNTDRLERYSESSNNVTLQTNKVFEILKSTFCIRDTCPLSVVEKLQRRSQEGVDLPANSKRKLCGCLAGKNACISKKNLEDNSSTIDTETYNTSFDNVECLCHVSYTLDTWHQTREAPCKVKIIPIQFSSGT